MDPTEKEHHDKDGKPPPKEIDNKVLAAMLRESASIVERGEFDPILYNALQDFRVYYKVHYPTKKKDKARSRSRSRSRPRDKTKVSSNSSVSSHAKDAGKQHQQQQAQPVVANGDSVQPTSSKSLESVSVDGSAAAAKVKREDLDSGRETSRTMPAEVFEPEPTSEPHIPDMTGMMSQPPQGSPSVSRSIRSVDTTAAASGPSPMPYSSPSTIQKATANMFLGKLKLPKKMPLPNAAFAATSKKNADRVKEDLEAFNNPLAQQAESSRRRKQAGWCEVHFTMNCACQQTTSSTTYGSSTSHPLPHTSQAPTERNTNEHADPHAVNTSNNASPPHGVSTAAVRVTSAGESSEGGVSSLTVESTAAVKDVAGANPFDQESDDGEDDTFNMQLHHEPAKPEFQKPTNANSSLIANGWIEQHRRSKMRFVWKEVLASLVQGRKPGEETTLWIQREVVNPLSQKKELEALHQIPVKLLESCTYLDYTPDNRFTLKVYNAGEEFIFRCRTDQAALKWVAILQKHHTLSKGGGIAEKTSFEEEKKGPEPSSQQQQQRMTVNELRAICHGAGINTVGMERGQLERAAEEVRKRGTFFPPAPGAPQPIPVPHSAAPPQQQQQQTYPQAPTAPEQSQAPSAATGGGSSNAKLSISELRAICHGAGINTAGMERAQLEMAAEEVRKRGTYFPPPGSHPTAPAPPKSGGSHYSAPQPTTHTAAPPPAPQPESTQDRLSVSELRAICHGAGINTVGMERSQLERAAEEVRKRGTYFDPPNTTSTAPAPASHPQTAATGSQSAEELRREAAMRQEAEEKIRRAKDEYNRQMMEEEHRRRMAEQEHQRRVAEQQAAEQRRRYAEQQAAWQKQQQEQQAAEQRRRHEEAVRQQQQWQQQQWHQQQQQQQQQQWSQQQQQQWHQQQQRPQQQAQWHQQQQQQRPGAPPPQQQAHHHSAASEKYAKMANQTDEAGQAAVITRIKHDILIHWALQPPQLQMLRPIDHLLCSIHKVFPPALGVPAHDYFTKWNALTGKDVCNDAGLPDEERLKKAVRKLRFFLHPDKIPKDLNSEQSFMVKMLWDVTSDAWEEFEKRKEDLDWINK